MYQTTYNGNDLLPWSVTDGETCAAAFSCKEAAEAYAESLNSQRRGGHLMAIRLLVEADTVSEAQDAVSGMLSEGLLRKYNPGSALIDWEYAPDESISAVTIPADYDEGGLYTLMQDGAATCPEPSEKVV